MSDKIQEWIDAVDGSFGVSETDEERLRELSNWLNANQDKGAPTLPGLD